MDALLVLGSGTLSICATRESPKTETGLDEPSL